MSRRFQFGQNDGAEPPRRSPLGWPAALLAILLLSVAAYGLWNGLSYNASRGGHIITGPDGTVYSLSGCGMPAGIAVIGACFLVAVAVGVVCLDMLIRLMDP